MATIADELNAISVEHGYTGAAPKTIAGAIDALADTLAGTDVEGKRTIAGAVKALAPYIGSGGGAERVELFDETVTTVADGDMVSGFVQGTNTTADKVYVTFDGTEYELPRVETSFGYIYGADVNGSPDFSTYPLLLTYNNEQSSWLLFTKDAGTHTIAAYVEPTPMPALGSMQGLMYFVETAPVVGADSPKHNQFIRPDAFINGVLVADTCNQLAAGVEVYIANASVNSAYAATFNEAQSLDGNPTYATVRQIELEAGGSGGFVMPALERDESTGALESLVLVGTRGGGIDG